MFGLFRALTDALNVMQGYLFEEPTFWHFMLVDLILAAGAAWMTGRSCARTWRPFAVNVFFLLLLACAVRFVHYALFQVTFLSFHYFLIDLAIVQFVGFIGFRETREAQMQAQYGWLRNDLRPLR